MQNQCMFERMMLWCPNTLNKTLFLLIIVFIFSGFYSWINKIGPAQKMRDSIWNALATIQHTNDSKEKIQIMLQLFIKVDYWHWTSYRSLPLMTGNIASIYWLRRNECVEDWIYKSNDFPIACRKGHIILPLSLIV